MLPFVFTIATTALMGCVAADTADTVSSLKKQWAKLHRSIPASPWRDQHTRYKYRPGDGTAEKIKRYVKKRMLMDATDPDTGKPYGEDPTGTFVGPRPDGKAKMNGEVMDYGIFDCPWEQALDPDYPAMCLPYQEILSPLPKSVLDTEKVFGVGLVGNFSVRGTNFVMPDGKRMECSDEIMRLTGGRCAAGNAKGGHGAICEGYIEDCTFSKADTRKCDNDKCKKWQKATDCMKDKTCHADYPDARVPYPSVYPGNDKGSFVPVSDKDEAGKCSKHDSALQWLKCGIPCPLKFPMEAKDFVGQAVVVIIFIIISVLMGIATFFKIKGDPENFFVAGRNLPIWVLVCTLGSQCLDASCALGNLDLSYKYHFWDGAALPIGLCLSLVLVGVFFAKPLNEMRPLTLPDCFARVYGEAAEIMCSLVTIVSFIFLLAGNLVGCGKIVSFLFGMDDIVGIVLATFLIWIYSCAGGMFSIAYTDVIQACIGWSGFLVATAWIQRNMPNHAPVSPAYPVGDSQAFASGITDPDSYDPIPNAIFFNWVTVIVLMFGNCMALDFNARCFSAKSGRAAQIACLLAAVIAGFLGIFNTMNAGTTRALYGPSSPHAEFVANSCSADITVIGCFGAAAGDPKLGKVCNAVPVPGVPTCGEWKPDPNANLKMLTCSKAECHPFLDLDGSSGYDAGTEKNFPISGFIGTWYLLGIIAASMSTADGAIVALGTVFSHNLLRKTGKISSMNLLISARASTLLFAIIAGLIAMTKPNETGYFLIVAFDCVFAAGVIPLFALVYWRGIKPEAGFFSLVGGAIARIILEFALPKDGLLLAFGKYARNFGPAIEDPQMFDEAVMFGKIADICPQDDLLDLTGLDSLVSPAVSLVVLVVVQLLPLKGFGGRWFTPVPAAADDTADKAEAAEPPAEKVGASESADNVVIEA